MHDNDDGKSKIERMRLLRESRAARAAGATGPTSPPWPGAIEWPEAGATKTIMNNRVEAVAVDDARPFFKIERTTERGGAGGAPASVYAVAPHRTAMTRPAIEAWGRVPPKRLRAGTSATFVGRTGDGRHVFALEERRPGRRRTPTRLVAVAESEYKAAAIPKMSGGRSGSRPTGDPGDDRQLR